MGWWILLQYSWVAVCVLLFFLVSLLIWKFRGIFHWRRSLKKELRQLEKEREKASPQRVQALGLIISESQKILGSPNLDLGEYLKGVPLYFRSLARCYHPESEKPELEISLGRILRCLEESTDRMDAILNRPGFRKIRRLKIRHILRSREWYLSLMQNRFVAWFFKNRRRLEQISFFRLIVLPDPFSWLAYLSQHLSILLFSKYLLLDIYLYLGKLALYSYDESDPTSLQEGEEELQEVLEELEILSEKAPPRELDPLLEAKRRELTSFTALWISPPGWKEWKIAVEEGARHIATKHFPDSLHPLEEAALGPLLERTRDWLGTLSEGQNWKGLGYLYQFRLSTVMGISSWTKEVSGKAIPQFIKPLAKQAWTLYGWMKWPLKAYKWIKKASPLGVALDLGWMGARKTLRGYIFSRTFEMAAWELEEVYEASSKMKETGKEKEKEKTKNPDEKPAEDHKETL